MQFLHYHYLNEAARMIQKVWRGYFTRKVLAAYLQVYLDQQPPVVAPRCSEDNTEGTPNTFFSDMCNVQNNSQEKQLHYSTIRSVSEMDQEPVAGFDCKQLESLLSATVQDPNVLRELTKQVQTFIKQSVMNLMQEGKSNSKA